MVSKKPKAKASSAWKKKYTKDVTKAATCRPHDGGGLPVPCSKIFPMDCPKDWSELCRALEQWGKCWETWGNRSRTSCRAGLQRQRGQDCAVRTRCPLQYRARGV